MERKSTVILITGHPATGKTTLAHQLAAELQLPLIWKDQIKETLLNTLGSGSDKWSRKLGQATWVLLYQQVENLLTTNVSFIVESNFDPHYANEQWQNLASQYDFHFVQIRCTTEPSTLLKRYVGRIESGERHIGHVDDRNNPTFLASIKQPLGWVEVQGEWISLDTTDFVKIETVKIAQSIKTLNR